MSPPRHVTKKRTVFVTRRCIQRMFLLAPDPKINHIIRYCLGHAAQIYGVEVHAFHAASNHYHGVFTDHFGFLPDFFRCFHELVARAVNARRGRWGCLWDEGQTSVVDCATPADAYRKLIYTVTNAAKDHLVERAHHWPGVNSLTPQLLGTTKRIRRPAGFFQSDGPMPSTVSLRFTRPPGFAQLSDEIWLKKVRKDVKDVEIKAARERASKGTPVLGCRAIKRQNPFHRATSYEQRRKTNPRIAAKNTKQRIDLIKRQQQWRAAYRKAFLAHRAGNQEVAFPFGTYHRRIHTAVRCNPGPGILPIPYALTLRDAL